MRELNAQQGTDTESAPNQRQLRKAMGSTQESGGKAVNHSGKVLEGNCASERTKKMLRFRRETEVIEPWCFVPPAELSHIRWQQLSILFLGDLFLQS